MPRGRRRQLQCRRNRRNHHPNAHRAEIQAQDIPPDPVQYVLADFRDCQRHLRDYFRPYMENVDHPDERGSEFEFDWTCITASTRYLTQNLFYNDNTANFQADFVFGLIEKYQCTDKTLIRNWLRLFCMFRLCDYGYEMVQHPSKRFEFRHPYNNNELSFIRVPFYESHYRKFSVRLLVLRPFLMQDTEIVKRLIRYEGITTRSIKVEVYSYIYDLLQQFIFDPDLIYFSTSFDIDTRHLRRFRSETRLKFILLIIDALIQKRQNEKYSHHAIDSVKLVFKAISEPFITEPELRLILLLIFRAGNNPIAVEGFSDNFLEEFPKGEEPYQPRSLKHLCRCEIRSLLKARRMLPFGAKYFDIPTTLKNYLLLQGNENEYIPSIF